MAGSVHKIPQSYLQTKWDCVRFSGNLVSLGWHMPITSGKCDSKIHDPSVHGTRDIKMQIETIHGRTEVTLTHWGPVTHICIRKLTTNGSDNGLTPGRHQSIAWTNCWNIINWTLSNKLRWNFRRNSYICTQESVFRMSSAKWWSQLDVNFVGT